MRTLGGFLFLFLGLVAHGQDGFFQWKSNHYDRILQLKDSISSTISPPKLPGGLPETVPPWVIEKQKQREKAHQLTLRFQTLWVSFSEWVQDSVLAIEKKRLELLQDSVPERHKILVLGLEKMQLQIKESSKSWWAGLIEKELLAIEWENHLQWKMTLAENSQGTIREKDSIWMVQAVRGAQEALILKNQLLAWQGGTFRSKMVYSLKVVESVSSMKNNWNYFHGCDSFPSKFDEALWKTVWQENRWTEQEKEKRKETTYFTDLQKNRENWEFLDRRENALAKMREYVVQYDRVFQQEDSLRGIAIMRARSSQELIDLKRERERWKISYYQKGMAQLAEIGAGIEGGPTVKDYSKQRTYFKLKDVQNVKKTEISPVSLETIPEEKETNIPVKALGMLQIPDWRELPNTFKTLK